MIQKTPFILTDHNPELEMFHVKHFKKQYDIDEAKEGFVGWFDNFNRNKREQTSAEIKNVSGISVSEQVQDSQRESDNPALDKVDNDHSPRSIKQSPEEYTEINEGPFVSEDLDDEPASAPENIFTPTPIKSYKDKKPVDHEIDQTMILAIINQKGGVGKSTTAVNLAAALGEAGKQVLLLDLDPQGNTTSGLGIDKGQIKQCVYDVLLDEVPVEETIIPDITERVDLVPATINLAGAEVELVSAMSRENRLKAAIESLRGKYDFVLIDCPPSLGLLTINALVAADKLIIPIQTEFYALEGVTKLLESMKRVKTLLNPELEIFGILLTMYDGRTTLSRQVASEVRNFFGDQVFETIIPRTVKLSEAPSYGIPITLYDPMGKGATAYTELAKEVIARG